MTIDPLPACDHCRNSRTFTLKTIDGPVEVDCIYCCAKQIGTGEVVDTGRP